MKKLFLILTLCAVCLPAYAKIDYVVEIPVNKEAENSVAAKEEALTEAQRQAFLEVAGKLVSEKDVEQLNTLSDDSIQYFIQSVGVKNEKAGGVKYVADLSVQINEQLLKEYLAENDMIKMEAEELLVIPVFKADAESYPLLWEEANLWRRYWRSKGLIKFGAINMRTMGDDFRAIWELNADNALYMPNEMYEQISKFNGSDRVYVVYAETTENGDLKITLKNEKNKAEESFDVYNEHHEQNKLFDAAIEKSVMFIANMEREAKNNDAAPSFHSLNAVYMYQDMKDWLEKSKIMASLEPVEGIDTQSFGGGKVNFSIRYIGSLDDLWDAMQENGFSHEAAGNYYIIR